DIPSMVLDLPVGQLVLQAINGKQEVNTVQEAQTGRLVRAAMPIAASERGGEIGGVVVVDAYVPESLQAKMEGIGRQYLEYKQLKAMKKSDQGGGLSLCGCHHRADSIWSDLVWILCGAQYHGADSAIGRGHPDDRTRGPVCAHRCERHR